MKRILKIAKNVLAYTNWPRYLTAMDFCFISSTTYGTWLPGNPRGSVTSVRDYRPSDPKTKNRIEHDRWSEPWEEAIPGLYASAQALLKQPPVYFTPEQARLVIEQFRETCAYRGWRLCAVSVMRNHFHAVVGKQEAVRLEKVLGDLKSYASRTLARHAGRKQRWWTEDGSKRILPSARAIANATHYTLYEQPYPLARWREEIGDLAADATAERLV